VELLIENDPIAFATPIDGLAEKAGVDDNAATARVIKTFRVIVMIL
jgi:hypothetical protein